jgi:hypothetical protein
MSDSFPNRPQILRGAFVQFGLSLPPLFVVFQFNPLQLTRSHSLSYPVPNSGSVPRSYDAGGGWAAQSFAGSQSRTLRQWHSQYSDLIQLQQDQIVTVEEETISFDIRLDATDALDDGDPIAEQFGIGPQLATLEQMVYPDSSGLSAITSLLGQSPGFSFTKEPNPPLILFIFGRKRVLPVNISSMNITETEFSTDLNPTRATVAVNMSVIEGQSPPYLYTIAMKEVMSLLNLANIASLANVVIPG